MKSHHLDKLITRTQIMIAPSYVPKIVNKLVTNFHQPHSTLLLLIAALIGKDWEMLYQFALNNDYRFLSYGDGCLIDFSA
jgi:S-adenosylmethionine:tRNA ribosyltransferase-isomerase